MERATGGDTVVARLSESFDLYERTIWPFEFDPSDEAPAYEASLYGLPGLGIAYSSTSSSRVRRKARHLLNDDLVLRINIAGSRTLCQSGREAAIAEGDAVLSSGAEICTAATSVSRFVSFRVPLKPIKALVPDVEDRTARRIGNSAPLCLLRGYADVLRDQHALATAELRQLAVTHVHDLVALSLGTRGDAAELARGRGGSAARLRAIKADIAAHLTDPKLSLGAIALRQGVSPRYVRMLFEAEGSSFTEFVLRERSARAYSMLTDRRFAHLTISTIAFEAGFGDLSYFNRCFRRRFGDTPRGVRAALAAGR
jgi:AraC-like DNA-binding protein